MDGVHRILLVLAVLGAACGQKKGSSRSPYQYASDPVVDRILNGTPCGSHGQHGGGMSHGRRGLHYRSGGGAGRAACGSTEWYYNRCSGQGGLELTPSGHQPSNSPWHAGTSATGDLIFIQEAGNGMNVILSFCPGPGVPDHGAPTRARFEGSRPGLEHGGQGCPAPHQVSRARVSFESSGGGRVHTDFGPIPCRGGRF